QPDGSEEPLPSKRKRKTFPSTVQVTYVMPGASVFVLTHVPENSDGEGERRASAPILSSRSCALRCFTSKLRKPDDCSIGRQVAHRKSPKSFFSRGPALDCRFALNLRLSSVRTNIRSLEWQKACVVDAEWDWCLRVNSTV